MELLTRYICGRIGNITELGDYIGLVAQQVFANHFDGSITSAYNFYKMESAIKQELEIRLLPFMPRGIIAEVECTPSKQDPGNINISWYLTDLKGNVIDPNDAIRRMNRGAY